MRMLHLYLVRRFLFWFAAVALALGLLLSIVNLIELLRRAAGRADMDFALVTEISLLKLPVLLQEALPFIVLFAALAAFWRLSRFQEITLMRAAGLSVWGILLPPLAAAFMLGILQITLLGPFSALFQEKFDALEAAYLKRVESRLAVSGTGIWMRQGHAEGQVVIHARGLREDGAVLDGVSIFLFDGDNRFLQRVDGAQATLQPGGWLVADGYSLRADGRAAPVRDYVLPTGITPAGIREGLPSPRALSVWRLPGYIADLDQAGFNTRPYRLQLHAVMSQPLILCAMVLAAAAFSLRSARRARLGGALAGGLFCGFLLYILAEVIHALGLSTTLPLFLAAWAPAGISLMLGLTALLYLEDM